MLRDKFNDSCGAADAFAAAAEKPGAPPSVTRLAAYELAACQGREREAYQKLRAIYSLGEEERMPSVISLINQLEAQLNIPAAERLAPPAAP